MTSPQGSPSFAITNLIYDGPHKEGTREIEEANQAEDLDQTEELDQTEDDDQTRDDAPETYPSNDTRVSLPSCGSNTL